MNLHLEKGPDWYSDLIPKIYLPVVLTSWEGTRCYNYSPFIYAFRQKTWPLQEREKSTGMLRNLASLEG